MRERGRGQLHAGVHLPMAAGQAKLPVHALAAGDIVAARLGAAGESQASSLSAAGNHNAFVLVRHRIAVDTTDEAANDAMVRRWHSSPHR